MGMGLVAPILYDLPLPLLSPRNVGVSEWQFGHSRRTFCGVLLFEFPSIWSISSGTFPVTGFLLLHPQAEHCSPCVSIRWRRIWPETPPIIVPSTSFLSQLCTNCL
jgi:hypothetical protein